MKALAFSELCPSSSGSSYFVHFFKKILCFFIELEQVEGHRERERISSRHRAECRAGHGAPTYDSQIMT